MAPETEGGTAVKTVPRGRARSGAALPGLSSSPARWAARDAGGRVGMCGAERSPQSAHVAADCRMLGGTLGKAEWGGLLRDPRGWDPAWLASWRSCPPIVCNLEVWAGRRRAWQKRDGQMAGKKADPVGCTRG